MTEHRTVAAERDMPRVREWIDQAVRHAVNEAAQALHAVRYWCDHETEVAQSLIASGGCCGEDGGDEQCALCVRAYETRLNAIREVRALLPDLPTVGAVSVEGGVDMTGTRVTRFGGEDGDAAFGGSETDGGSDSGNREGDRDW